MLTCHRSPSDHCNSGACCNAQPPADGASTLRVPQKRIIVPSMRSEPTTLRRWPYSRCRCSTNLTRTKRRSAWRAWAASISAVPLEVERCRGCSAAGTMAPLLLRDGCEPVSVKVQVESHAQVHHARRLLLSSRRASASLSISSKNRACRAALLASSAEETLHSTSCLQCFRTAALRHQRGCARKPLLVLM